MPNRVIDYKIVTHEVSKEDIEFIMAHSISVGVETHHSPGIPVTTYLGAFTVLGIKTIIITGKTSDSIAFALFSLKFSHIEWGTAIGTVYD